MYKPVVLLLIFFINLSGPNASAHEIENKFEKFAIDEHCQELENDGKKVKLCIASVKLASKSTITYGAQFYCIGKLKISEEGIVQGVSVKKSRGNKRLLRHCLTSMRKFRFYPPIDENGKNTNLKKVIMSMNYIEKKYAMPDITPYNVFINFGEVKSYKSRPFSGFAMLVFAVHSPRRIGP